MAKKKVSNKTNKASNDEKMQTQEAAQVAYQKPSELSRVSSMEDNDSFQNLKSLNGFLLKQTVEKRQQIESLSQAKDALEVEFSRSSDERFMLELEMELSIGFLKSRVKEMNVEVDGLVKEKSGRESEIRVLKREVNDLLVKLDSERKELSKVKDDLVLAEVERDNVCKALDEEKRNRVGFEEKIVELEKTVQGNGKEFEKIKYERVRMIKEKGELENRSDSLSNENGVLHKAIVEMKRAKAVVETEVEVVRKAVKDKESVVEEMKKEVEMMKHLVKDVNQKKRFWTIVSSITNLFIVAAAAAAYVATY